MEQWLGHPAVQAGVVPFVVALAVVLAGRRIGLAWIAPTAAYLSAVALTTGVSFQPLTAGRKVLLLALLAPIVGGLLDRVDRRGARTAACAIAGAASVWAFWTVLVQRPAAGALAAGAGIAAFVFVACALALRLRDDGAAAGATGVGLGLATGIGALLSASTGYFNAGVALAAGSGALLAVQFASNARLRPGALGTLAVALASALFAVGTVMLAQLPWHALALLLAVPAVGAVPLPAAMATRTRLVVRTLAALAAAALPVLAAWVAAGSVPN